jgi:hypothetical protein
LSDSWIVRFVEVFGDVGAVEFTESEEEPEVPEDEVPQEQPHKEPEEPEDEVPDDQPAGTAPWHCRTPDSFEPDEVRDDLREDAVPM